MLNPKGSRGTCIPHGVCIPPYRFHGAQCRTLLGHAPRAQARDEATDPKRPEVFVGEPGVVCPVCQHGRMQLVQTLYRQPAVWGLAVPVPGLDTS
jgi:hypothetical protein